MSGIWGVGDVAYDIDDAKLAIAYPAGHFGSLVDLPSVNLYAGEFNIRSAEARGDGSITAVASSIDKATVTMRNVSFNQAALSVMLGYSTYSYGTSPNARQSMKISVGKSLPYFAVAGRALSDGPGCHLLAFYWLKIMQSFELRFEDNNFVASEIRATALAHPSIRDDATGERLLAHIMEYEYRREIVLPLPLS